MGFLDRITSLWRNKTEEVNVNLVETPISPFNVDFGVGTDRRSMIKDSRDMVADDPRPKQILKTLARDSLRGGFTVSVTGPRAEEAQDVLAALVERLKLFSYLSNYLRLSFRDGESFIEIGVSNDGLIRLLSRKPTLEMYRNSNQHDLFEDPTKAFFWTDSPYYTALPNANVIWFEEWRIIHARWEVSDESKYGEPLLASARKPYKRMTEGERDLSIRRKTRSTIKYVHVLEGATLADIEAYKAANEPALNDPFAAISDYFTNKSGAVQVIQGDGNLDQIGDIEHHVDTFGVASPVPLELIGYGRNLNRDVLEQKKEQYDEAVASVQSWTRDEIIFPLFERQLLLLGFWPESLVIDLQWKQKKRVTPAELQQISTFTTGMQSSGLLSDETLLRMIATYLPEFDVDKEIERLQMEPEVDITNLVADAEIPPQDEEPDGDEEEVDGAEANTD